MPTFPSHTVEESGEDYETWTRPSSFGRQAHPWYSWDNKCVALQHRVSYRHDLDWLLHSRDRGQQWTTGDRWQLRWQWRQEAAEDSGYRRKQMITREVIWSLINLLVRVTSCYIFSLCQITVASWVFQHLHNSIIFWDIHYLQVFLTVLNIAVRYEIKDRPTTVGDSRHKIMKFT